MVSSIFVGGAFAAPSEKIPVIIGFKDSPDANSNANSDVNLMQDYDGDIKYEYSSIHAIAVSLPPQAIEALRKNPKVAYVEDDVMVQATEYNGGGLEDWGVMKIGANLVHPINKGSGIKVAVIDTGIYSEHQDLASNYAGGYNFLTQGTTAPLDDNGHGTHCAGIIAAALNEIGVVGVAPQASLYALKVLDSSGSGYTSDIIKAIEWADTNGIQVISMSLGSSVSDISLQAACDNAFLYYNIVVVAAAGNNGAARTGSNILYPARYSSVIAVGATDSNNVRASFSNTGPELDLVAPGVNICSDYRYLYSNHDTVFMSGTSMATPHVAGVAALILNTPETAWPSYTNMDGKWQSAEVAKVLTSTAKDLGATGKDNFYGYGIADTTQLKTISAVTSPKDFSISSSTSSLTIGAGTSGTSTITVASLNGFSSDVSLSGSAPTGLSAAFSSSSVTGGSGSSTLTVTVDSTTKAGTYTVTVTGTSGLLTHSATVTVTVVTPDFSISASPSAMTLKSGAKGTSTITVKSLNTFSDTVGLEVTGPTGWTASVNPASLKPVSGGSATSLLSITVPSVRTGTFTFTITGTDTSGFVETLY